MSDGTMVNEQWENQDLRLLPEEEEEKNRRKEEEEISRKEHKDGDEIINEDDGDITNDSVLYLIRMVMNERTTRWCISCHTYFFSP